jgi:large subunit ribosomal protein L23
MNIILSPLITEKSMQDASQGKFTFRVYRRANKLEIKKAVEKNFKVDVTHVSTSVLKGKKQRVGARRIEKEIQETKKAIVTVKKGQKIGLFELGGDDKK